MRDLKNVDATGKGKSKEYGFVVFTIFNNIIMKTQKIIKRIIFALFLWQKVKLKKNKKKLLICNHI